VPPFVRHALLRAAILAGVLLTVAPVAIAHAQTGGATAPQAPVGKAVIRDGKAIAPSDAPPAVVNAIAAANRIAEKPYRYGGGHRTFEDTGYDCSGTVSYVLRGAGVLTSPLPSGPFMRWGLKGKGRWITVYAHGGHAFIKVAGLRFDTGWANMSAATARKLGIKSGRGPRWRYNRPSAGYAVRHPAGL
jgi:hypothetical protein